MSARVTGIDSTPMAAASLTSVLPRCISWFPERRKHYCVTFCLNYDFYSTLPR